VQIEKWSNSVALFLVGKELCQILYFDTLCSEGALISGRGGDITMYLQIWNMRPIGEKSVEIEH